MIISTLQKNNVTEAKISISLKYVNILIYDTYLISLLNIISFKNKILSLLIKIHIPLKI